MEIIFRIKCDEDDVEFSFTPPIPDEFYQHVGTRIWELVHLEDWKGFLKELETKKKEFHDKQFAKNPEFRKDCISQHFKNYGLKKITPKP